MIGFNHVISGVIIGSIAPLPAVPVIALTSHFVMDTLPHFGKSEVFKPYNKNFKLLLIFDALMCFIILGFGLCLTPDKKLAIIAGAFFAALPDFLWLLEGRIKWMEKYFWFAKKIQWGEMPDGWTYELIFFALMVVVFTLII